MTGLNLLSNINFDANLVTYVLLSPLVFVWVIWVIHTTVDIVRRTDSIMFELFCMILVTLLWPIGWIIYLIIRPPLLQLEKMANEAVLSNVQECLNCSHFNLHSHKYCVNCWEELKTTCKECRREYSKWYEYCPHCWAPNIE